MEGHEGVGMDEKGRERQGKDLTWIFVWGPGDPSNATGCSDWLHFQRVTSAAKQRVKFAADRASGSGRRIVTSERAREAADEKRD